MIKTASKEIGEIIVEENCRKDSVGHFLCNRQIHKANYFNRKKSI